VPVWFWKGRWKAGVALFREKSPRKQPSITVIRQEGPCHWNARRKECTGVTGPKALAGILKSLKLDSMERIDNLETLKELVLNLQEVARGRQA